jgi:hypothetical protein
MKLHRLSRIATVTLTIATVAAPTAMARTQDLRSPDARDAGAAVTQSRHARPNQDFRSPDARDAVRTSSLAGTIEPVDRRSPDARDAADGRGAFNAPEVTVVKIAPPAQAPGTGGLDWGDAGIGAGAMLGLTLIAVGGILALIHRRHVAQRRHQTATIA